MTYTEVLSPGQGAAETRALPRDGNITVFSRRVVAFLGSRYLLVVLPLAAVAVSLPALAAGLLTDDYVHRAMLIGPSESLERLSDVGLAPERSGDLWHALSGLFVAVHPDENLEQYRAYGALPWWTYEGYRVAFWRPVASLTHWLDYRLFPNSAALMHFHSMLWFAAVVFMVTLLYRRFVNVAWMAGLAGVLYLLSDDSYFPTVWLANRNLLISLFFGISALILHDRWRRFAWRPGVVAAPLCLLISVLATEGGIATFAYLFAYEVALRTGPWVKRLLALTPSVAVIVVWRLLYNMQGYGANGGGFYADPVREPIAYLAAVLQRGPFFLGGQWTAIPPELHNLLPFSGRIALWCVLALLVVLVPLALRPLLRVSRRARFWLIGMYGAALPICATVPMSRALMFVAVGAFALIAECQVGWDRNTSWVPQSGRRRQLVHLLAVGFFVVHLPLAVVARAGAPKVTSKLERPMAKTMAIQLYRRFQGQDLVIVNAPNPVSFLYDSFATASLGKSPPAAIRALAPAYGAVEVVRTGPRRIVVKSVSQSLLDCQGGRGLDVVHFYRYLSDVRGPGHPLTAGERIALPRVTVEVLAVDERGFPLEVAFEFAVPLEDRSLRWLCWDWDRGHYRVFDLPSVGQAVTLPGPF